MEYVSFGESMIILQVCFAWFFCFFFFIFYFPHLQSRWRQRQRCVCVISPIVAQIELYYIFKFKFRIVAMSSAAVGNWNTQSCHVKATQPEGLTVSYILRLSPAYWWRKVNYSGHHLTGWPAYMAMAKGYVWYANTIIDFTNLNAHKAVRKEQLPQICHCVYIAYSTGKYLTLPINFSVATCQN